MDYSPLMVESGMEVLVKEERQPAKAIPNFPSNIIFLRQRIATSFFLCFRSSHTHIVKENPRGIY
jgi:hypothetical protein